MQDAIQNIVESARLTLGFKPIFGTDVARLCRMHSTDDTDLAMKLAVVEFLRLEMKNMEIDTHNIVKVFPPAGRTIWDRL